MAFVLPNDDPSNPGLPAPLFADVDAVRGDQLRANDQLIWGNFDYIEANFTPEAKAAALAAALTGYVVGADTPLAATDLVLAAFGKLQGQRDALAARVATLDGAVTAWTPTIQGGGTLADVNCVYKIVGGILWLQGRLTLGSTSVSEFRLSLPASKTVDAALTQAPQLVGHLTTTRATGGVNKQFTLLATGGNTYLNFGLAAEVADTISSLAAQSTGTYLGNGQIISFFAWVPVT